MPCQKSEKIYSERQLWNDRFCGIIVKLTSSSLRGNKRPSDRVEHSPDILLPECVGCRVFDGDQSSFTHKVTSMAPEYHRRRTGIAGRRRIEPQCVALAGHRTAVVAAAFPALSMIGDSLVPPGRTRSQTKQNLNRRPLININLSAQVAHRSLDCLTRSVLCQTNRAALCGLSH